MKPRTAKQWADLLPEKMRDDLMQGYIECNKKYSSLIMALTNGFYLTATKSGWGYWDNVIKTLKTRPFKVVEVSREDDFNPVKNRILLHTLPEGTDFRYICVDKNDEEKYLTGKSFRCNSYSYMRHLPDPEPERRKVKARELLGGFIKDSNGVIVIASDTEFTDGLVGKTILYTLTKEDMLNDNWEEVEVVQ